MPPFENFSLNALNSKKPSAKNRLAGVDFEIYRSGRVEKVLTDSISVLDHSLVDVAYTTEIVHSEFRS